MKIYNATIKNVAIGLFGPRKVLSVKVVFSTQDTLWHHTFELTDWTSVSQLKSLIKFSDVIELKDVENKKIRIVVSNGLFRGIGHPEKDEFIAISYFPGRCPMNVNEKEFSEMLKNHLDYWH